MSRRLRSVVYLFLALIGLGLTVVGSFGPFASDGYTYVGLLLVLIAAILQFAEGFVLAGGIARVAESTGRGSDEGDELEAIDKTLRALDGELKRVATTLSGKAEILANVANEYAVGSEEVAAGAQEVSATIGEVAGNVERVAFSTRSITDSAMDAASLAEQGREGIKTVANQMGAINRASASAAKVIKELDSATQQITQIVDVITHIADQTNLLALNAAIEAARAGEHGRGFAVVADEVRKLAEQSAQSGKEIYALVQSIQTDSQRAVATMAEGMGEVRTGVKVVREVESTFERIEEAVKVLAGQSGQVADSAEKTVELVESVASNSAEQARAIEALAGTTVRLTTLTGELRDISDSHR